MAGLEKQIEEAAAMFALQVIEAVKSATVQELMALHAQGSEAPLPKKRGRKPGPKPQVEVEVEAEPQAKVDGRKNRVVKNYPKCAYPKCNNNRFPRGQGFCGEHWRLWKAGKIKSAAEYAKKTQ
jgi:hypothetical protein